MKVLQKIKTVERNEYMYWHLRIMMSMLPSMLTETELKVLAEFMSLEGEEFESDRFSSVCRRMVQERLGITQPSMSNYLKQLEAKGYIQRTEVLRKRFVPEFLFPENDMQGYQFKLEVKADEEEAEMD